MLKHQLITAPILSLPDFNHDFTLDIDASGNGLGAVLSQKVGDHERVIAYGSRALTKAKRKYCVTDYKRATRTSLGCASLPSLLIWSQINC